ncbi:MAG: chromate transporter [Clostridia bacterium]|nr:chromate transporter [Clostridia bacterium]
MFKIGLFTFGGGYAMIAIFENEFVSNKKWIDKDEFVDIVAIAESTPGPIAINSSTYIGYKVAGILGSIAGTLGMVLPSFTIIYIISLFFDKFLEFEYVKYAFHGIQACVIYLILTAGIKMFKSMKKDLFNTIIFAGVVVVMVALTILSIKLSTILYILTCGIIGLIIYLIGFLKSKTAVKKEDK